MPLFICDYFIRLGSEGTKVNNYIKIKSLLNWLIVEKYISKSDLSLINKDDISKINTTMIIKYLDSLKDNGLENNTVATYKNVLSGFWTYLVDDGYVASNIVQKIPPKRYKSRQKPVKIPAGNSLDMFINNVMSLKNEYLRVRNTAIVKLFLGSGIRISELIGLDIDDLYFDCKNPYIMILAKGEQDEEYKTKIKIKTDAVEAIKKYLIVRNNKYPNSVSKALFLSDENTRLSTDGISFFFKKLSNGEINPHMLRHFVGTRLYEIGGLHLAGEQLGHNDYNTTNRHYVSEDEDEAYAALNMI
jgi:site-specific recombinase XerC